jgi:hypothetical protein
MTLARLWFRSWDPLGAASALVAQWQRPPDSDSEQALEDSLFQFLQTRLPGFRITRQYAHDRLKADIVIEQAVAIELKYDLAHKSEYQRLIGQLEDYAQWNIPLVLILAGRTDPDIEHRVREHLERRFDSPYPRARLIMRP